MTSYHDIQQFLYREARLMDDHQYDAWLALWVTGAHYWIPCSDDGRGIDQAIAIVNEDMMGLEDRVKRLKSGAHYAQDPKTRLCRVVSNVEIVEDTDSHILVELTFNLTASRKGRIDIVAGRTTHTLVIVDQAFRLRTKKIMLANHDEVMSNLTYLV